MPVTILCQTCHMPFNVHPGGVNERKYCSRACMALGYRVPKVQLTCEECGKGYSLGPSIAKSPKRRYCSPDCSKKANGKRKKGSALRAFWNQVQRCEHGEDCPYCCWPWMGKTRNGYGRIKINYQSLGTHRVVWELINNNVFPDGLQAAHYCHNRPCCNPWHIHPATSQGNHDDSARDHRHLTGERHPRHKLTEPDINEALHLHSLGWSNVRIATYFEVTPANIGYILRGKTWKHITESPS